MENRILIFVNHDIVIYNFRKELIERLVSNNFKVILSSPNGPNISKLIEMGVEFIETPVDRHGKNLIKDLFLFFRYYSLIKHYKPLVVLTYTIKPNIYGGIVARLTKTPYIPNITGLGTAIENKGIIQFISLKMLRVAMKKACNIFLQNTENRDFLLKNKILNQDYKLIPGSGVNVDQYSFHPYPKEDPIIFLYIGRIMKEKGIEYFLESARYIKSKYNNKTEFRILGFCEENYTAKLNEYEEKGIIKYYGLVSNVGKFIQESHCTVHPTYYPEGMSNVLLETASIGRPIITTNRSGCREIVDEGKNGFLVPIKNQLELNSAIEKFIELDQNNKRLMGYYGRKKIEKEFDRRIVVDEYMQAINRILSNKR